MFVATAAKRLRIIYMSDIHGNMDMLARCAGLFAKDEDTIILDGGDTIQGSPFSTYIHVNAMGAGSIAQTLNIAGFDFITLGNHDFNYGTDYLRAYLNDLNAVCVCANVSGDLPVLPYQIHAMPNGLKIGITGIVTEYVNIWEKADNLRGVTISSPFEAAQEALRQMKDIADVCICIYHGGFECDLNSGAVLTTSTENIGSKICRELDFDILLTAHQHMLVEGCLHYGTFVVQPGSNAQQFIAITGETHDDAFKWTSRFVEPGHFMYPENNHLSAMEHDLQAWLDIPIGTASEPLLPADRAQMALHGSPIATLFNHIQRKATGAQISCVGLANNIPGFGHVIRMRDVIENYPFNNNLVTMHITGVQLVVALERAASYLSPDAEGVPQVSHAFLYPKVEHYNYDFFSGLTYTADLRKPCGERVSDVKVGGVPITDDAVYTLCMSSYRATGTGGYDVYKSCPTTEHGSQEISELIRDYISREGNITIKNEEAPNWISI